MNNYRLHNLAVVILLLWSLSSNAQTYSFSYTGAPLIPLAKNSPNCPPVENLTGNVTGYVDPTYGNFVITSGTFNPGNIPIDTSLSDVGVYVQNGIVVSEFLTGSSSSGNRVVAFDSAYPGPPYWTCSFSSTGSCTDFYGAGANGSISDCMYYNTSPGTWTTVSNALPTLFLVDPFSLGAFGGSDLTNLDLAQILPNVTPASWPTVTANGLVADDASAAIALFQTTVNADVTFTTINGTVLVPYTNNFLTTPPAAGASTLTVPASQLISAAGFLYAAVLVQAPPLGDTMHSFSAAVTVTAQQQGGQPAQATMSLVPPPVVLVHGIWGNKSSLQNIQNYLSATQPWQTYGLEEPICYSDYFAFDARNDPLTGNGNACEVTSASALSNEIGAIAQTLDTLQIVGGRVDIVAHSMGGLAARYYAATANYNSPSTRFRNRGAFHEVVTIDTPELGSKLATFLEASAGKSFAYRDVSPSGAAWLLGGCSFTDTVETCFANPTLNMPLTAPGYPLNVGAVYSLEPGYLAILDLPTAIPNTIFAPVGAIWPPQGAPQKSLLREELNLLIRGIYSSNVAAPTTDEILGTQSDDVIVTEMSQIENVSAGQYYVLSDLAHTGAADPSQLGPLLGGSNNNVLASTAVDQLVACLLQYEGSPSCTSASGPSVVEQGITTVSANSYQQWPFKFLATDRLEIEPISNATLGQPTDIPLRISGRGLAAGITHVVVSQNDEHGEITAGSGPSEIGQLPSSNYVEIIPQRLGLIKVWVTTWFGDGGLASSSISLNVQPPATPPLTFKADDLPVLGMTVGGSVEPVANLHPMATYPGVNEPVPVDPGFLQFTLLPEANGPVPVSIGPNGLIRALQPGKATIEVRFGSAVDRVAVTVQQIQ